MPSDEQVLVIPTQVLHAAGLFQGLSREVEHYQARLLDPANFSFLPRSKAEDDPSHKQLIPYVVLKCGDLVFHYRRGQAGGEKRLRALRSIGIGGHINPIDGVVNEHPYRQGMLREVAEEVRIETAYLERCVGFINDDSLLVGQVHLGIVHVFELEAPRAWQREAELMEAGFAPIAELLREKDEFETWSQIVLAELGLPLAA